MLMNAWLWLLGLLDVQFYVEEWHLFDRMQLVGLAPRRAPLFVLPERCGVGSQAFSDSQHSIKLRTRMTLSSLSILAAA
jgi:hypothetical protein